MQPCAFNFVKCLSMLCLTDIINICFSSAGTTEIHLYSAVYDSITNNDTCLTGRYWLVLYKATPLIMEWLKGGIVHMISWMNLIVLVLDGIFLARKLKKILHPEEMELNWRKRKIFGIHTAVSCRIWAWGLSCECSMMLYFV